MRPGDTLVFPGECSDSHNFVEAGDVQIKLQDADTEGRLYRLTGDNLAIKVGITLFQSLTGYKETIQGHPGFDTLDLVLEPGVQNGDMVVMEGKGLPRKDGGHGALHILVSVTATAAEKAALIEKKDVVASLTSSGGTA
jgi:DnaJ-class molecular chaperone